MQLKGTVQSVQRLVCYKFSEYLKQSSMLPFAIHCELYEICELSRWAMKLLEQTQLMFIKILFIKKSFTYT
jgi:hypothetical protein